MKVTVSSCLHMIHFRGGNFEILAINSIFEFAVIAEPRNTKILTGMLTFLDGVWDEL